MNPEDHVVTIGFRGYVTPRGDVMLDVLFDDQHVYRLGPFTNKEQRLVFVEDIRKWWTRLNRNINIENDMLTTTF